MAINVISVQYNGGLLPDIIQRQKKREAEEADKVEVAPGVTVASLRRFRTALIGPTQGLPNKRRRLCR